MMGKKLYLSAPLPFVGQKRMFAREYIRVLERQFKGHGLFVDLFGGSGLLSHITKRIRPDAAVVYNDFDNYRRRLENIPRTNRLLADIRRATAGLPPSKPLPAEAKEEICRRIAQEEAANGFMDYITLSPSLLFSMKYKTSLEELRKETFYNKVRKADYPLCPGYLEGLAIDSRDYREVFNTYKDIPGAVFLIDPPYLSTDTSTYSMNWRLADYLDVLPMLQGRTFVYFTSNKSSIIELCEWMGRNRTLGNPFEGCGRKDFNARMNFNSSYTDIMLYKCP